MAKGLWLCFRASISHSEIYHCEFDLARNPPPPLPCIDSIAVLCGEHKGNISTDLVCAAVQQVKTMYCESWL